MKEVILNIHFLKNEIAEQELKQWWIAEQVGVDQKTVSRWLHGKVKSVKFENVEKLVKILGCKLEDLVLASDEELLATNEDQKRAAVLISSSRLMDKLGPIHEWNVLEALIKATIIPNLPLFVLGELYNKLSVASWRQSKIDQASVYADRAFEISERTGDKSILASALINQANIHSWRGQTDKAIQKYLNCLSLNKFIEEKSKGTINSNLGAILYEIGELNDGLKYQRKALDIFKACGNDMNLSICYCQLSFVYLEMNDLNKAEEEARSSLSFAIKSDYLRGQQMGKLVLSEVFARRNDIENADQYLLESMEGFSHLGIEEGLNYEFAGRVSRILKRYDIAKEYLSRGIAFAEKFPVYLAALYREMAILLICQDEKSAFIEEYINLSATLYEKSGAPVRSKMVKNLFVSAG